MTSWADIRMARLARQRGSETIGGELRSGSDRAAKKSSASLAIAEAATWLRANRDRVRRSSRHPAAILQELFKLTSKEARLALQLAHDLGAKEGTP